MDKIQVRINIVFLLHIPYICRAVKIPGVVMSLKSNRSFRYVLSFCFCTSLLAHPKAFSSSKSPISHMLLPFFPVYSQYSNSRLLTKSSEHLSNFGPSSLLHSFYNLSHYQCVLRKLKS